MQINDDYKKVLAFLGEEVDITELESHDTNLLFVSEDKKVGICISSIV